MNYREWLLYRAQQHVAANGESEVMRYDAWRNYQAVRDWTRRSDAAHVVKFTGHDRPAGLPGS
jgi:hypothetical protein